MLDAHLIVLLYLRHDACVCVRVLCILLPEHLYIHLLECTGGVVVSRESLAHVVVTSLLATLVQARVILHIVLTEGLLIGFSASLARKLLLLKLAFCPDGAALQVGGVTLGSCHICRRFLWRAFLRRKIHRVKKRHNLVVVQVA